MHGWGIYKTAEQERQDIEILNLVDHVVSISKTSENLLIKKGLSNPNKSCIYNGLQIEEPKESSMTDPHLRTIKNLKEEGNKIVGVVGTIDSRKNQSLVLESLPLLPQSLKFQVIFVPSGTFTFPEPLKLSLSFPM